MPYSEKNPQRDQLGPEVYPGNYGKEVSKETFQDDEDTECGIGSCTPSGIQCCANVGLFTATAGVASLCLQTLSTYIASQVTSLEKQFGLTSTDSGILVSCNDIGFLTTVLLFSHFGRKGHIPRILALSAIIYGIAGVVCSLSQFIEPASLPKVGSEINNDSSSGYLCSTGGTTNSPNNTCTTDESSATGSSRWVVYMLAIALVVQGICKSPRTPLSTVYIDNNINDRKRTGLFLGIITTLTLFGPAIAFTLGGVFSKIPVDLQDTHLEPSDNRWIGAWWLGFLMFGSVSVAVSFPLFFFPKRLKGRSMESQKGNDENTELSLSEKIKGLPMSVVRVLRSPVYTLTLVAITLTNFTVGGYVSFGPKYLESVFMIPAWKANIIQGIQAAISIGVGTFFGGYFTSRFKLNPRGCLKFVIVACIVALATESLNFIFGCELPSIAGLHSKTTNTSLETGLLGPVSKSVLVLQQRSLDEGPSTGCECDDVPYLPVCGGTTGTTYFSPCHAGCRILNETIYGDCIAEAGNDVSMGLCDTGCPYLYPYVGTTVLYSLVGTFAIIPAYIIMIRSVEEKDKSMAIGILSFTISLLGFFPAPIVYGKVIDTTCQLWNYSCGTQGSCAVYDIVDMKIKVVGMNMGLRFGATTMYLIAFLVRKFILKPDKTELSSEDTADTKL